MSWECVCCDDLVDDIDADYYSWDYKCTKCKECICAKCIRKILMCTICKENFQGKKGKNKASRNKGHCGSGIITLYCYDCRDSEEHSNVAQNCERCSDMRQSNLFWYCKSHLQQHQRSCVIQQTKQEKDLLICDERIHQQQNNIEITKTKIQQYNRILQSQEEDLERLKKQRKEYYKNSIDKEEEEKRKQEQQKKRTSTNTDGEDERKKQHKTAA